MRIMWGKSILAFHSKSINETVIEYDRIAALWMEKNINCVLKKHGKKFQNSGRLERSKLQSHNINYMQLLPNMTQRDTKLYIGFNQQSIK